jgi:D-alanyl-D-alanine carboxypeptidase
MSIQARIVISVCAICVIIALCIYILAEHVHTEAKVSDVMTVTEQTMSPETVMDTTPEPEVEETSIEEKTTEEIQTTAEETTQEEVVQKVDITKLSWKLTLVNSAYPLEQTTEPSLATVEDGYRVDKRIKKALEQMLSDARDDGVYPIICSAYRSNAKQTVLFQNKVRSYMDKGYSKKKAEKKAATIVAPPGTSEHATGLAVDIISSSYQKLDTKQEETAEAKWLKKHCAEYGFILRYPVDKTDVTGIIYEPWHYRYVGVKAAKEIMKKGLCLE